MSTVIYYHSGGTVCGHLALNQRYKQREDAECKGTSIWSNESVGYNVSEYVAKSLL